jgi:hypothetical protein
MEESAGNGWGLSFSGVSTESQDIGWQVGYMHRVSDMMLYGSGEGSQTLGPVYTHPFGSGFSFPTLDDKGRCQGTDLWSMLIPHLVISSFSPILTSGSLLPAGPITSTMVHLKPVIYRLIVKAVVADDQTDLDIRTEQQRCLARMAQASKVNRITPIM